MTYEECMTQLDWYESQAIDLREQYENSGDTDGDGNPIDPDEQAHLDQIEEMINQLRQGLMARPGTGICDDPAPAPTQSDEGERVDESTQPPAFSEEEWNAARDAAYHLYYYSGNSRSEACQSVTSPPSMWAGMDPAALRARLDARINAPGPWGGKSDAELFEEEKKSAEQKREAQEEAAKREDQLDQQEGVVYTFVFHVSDSNGSSLKGYNLSWIVTDSQGKLLQGNAECGGGSCTSSAQTMKPGTATVNLTAAATGPMESNVQSISGQFTVDLPADDGRGSTPISITKKQASDPIEIVAADEETAREKLAGKASVGLAGKIKLIDVTAGGEVSGDEEDEKKSSYQQKFTFQLPLPSWE
jgi:hypothetical protein